MSRRLCGFIRDGKYIQASELEQAPDVDAPFVQDDTLAQPLRNMLDDRIYDSKSAYIRTVKQHGCEIVGNDLLSKRKRRVPDKLTDAVVMDAIQKAEAICSDPFKLNQHRNMNQMLVERRERLLNGRR